MGGGGTMSGIEKIPAEMRWMIATRAANDLPFAYSLAFKKVVGEMYEHELSNAMNEIWAAAGSEQGVLAKAFGLPVHSAKSVADAFSTLSVLFMGPEMDNGGIKVKKGDTAVLTLESCPMVNRARAWGSMKKRFSHPAGHIRMRLLQVSIRHTGSALQKGSAPGILSVSGRSRKNRESS